MAADTRAAQCAHLTLTYLRRNRVQAEIATAVSRSFYGPRWPFPAGVM
jgi:hypothetical protein